MSNPSQQQELQQGAQSFSQDEFSSLLNKEFRPKTDQARSAVESAVKTLAQQALDAEVTVPTPVLVQRHQPDPARVAHYQPRRETFATLYQQLLPLMK